jgi:predicted amidophosphoribosyltransferase
LLRRGHHPAGALAHALGVPWNLPVAELLTRTRLSSRQTGLRFDERRRNVIGAFAARCAVPPAVVLVDDVYTTGATVSAGASALRAGGARTVAVVTFARTVR